MILAVLEDDRLALLGRFHCGEREDGDAGVLTG